MTEWTGVKDKLPEEGKEILAYCINIDSRSFEAGARYCAIDRWESWKDGTFAFSTEYFGYGKVTHWMPLPEGPND